MVEAGANEVSEEKMTGALVYAQEYVDVIADGIAKFAKENGKTKRTIAPIEVDPEIKKFVASEIGDLEELLKNEATKTGTQASTIIAAICVNHPDSNPSHIAEAADNLLRDLARKNILEKNHRPDGRDVEEIRPIDIEVGVLPRTHGSAFFKRGLTHVLSVVTLASPAREQLIDGMKGESTKRYMHHYNMPGYAAGEVGRPAAEKLVMVPLPNAPLCQFFPTKPCSLTPFVLSPKSCPAMVPLLKPPFVVQPCLLWMLEFQSRNLLPVPPWA